MFTLINYLRLKVESRVRFDKCCVYKAYASRLCATYPQATAVALDTVARFAHGVYISCKLESVDGF